MTTTAFIPARWESTRLPHKNYLPCAGESLVSRAIRVAVAARDIGLVQQVVVAADCHVTSADVGAARYTDSRAGHRVSIEYNRKSLDGHDVTVSQLLAGFIAEQRDWMGAALFCVLLPTSPLRTLRHLVESRLLLRPDVDLVMSVTPIRANLRRALSEQDGRLGLLDSLWSEEIRPLIHDGTVIWCTRAVAEAGTGFYDWWQRKCVAYHVPPEESVDVNTRFDFDVADFLLRRPAASSQTP